MGWPLRTLLVLKDNKGNFVFYMCPFLCGWVGHMMECTAVGLDRGTCVVLRRPLTHTPSMYSWRCTNIAACRQRGASGESTASAISRTSLRTAIWRQSHLLRRNPRRTQQLRSAPRHGARELRGVLVGCNLLPSVHQAPAVRNVCSRPCACDAFACMWRQRWYQPRDRRNPFKSCLSEMVR